MYSQVSYPTPTTAVLTITDAGPLNVLSTPVVHARGQLVVDPVPVPQQRRLQPRSERLGLSRAEPSAHPHPRGLPASAYSAVTTRVSTAGAT